LDDNIIEIFLIPQDIARVFLNLFNNAFYSVTEKRKRSDENFKPVVSVTTKRESNNIEVVIRDNGTGIPQKIVHKIFQPFFTTKPTGQGTGLGLSLSYDIIKAHGGEIRVESVPEESTKFILNLPI
jgi:signal transduction histidine kinase